MSCTVHPTPARILDMTAVTFTTIATTLLILMISLLGFGKEA